MLPHNNYLSYQTLPNPSQYTFDLKVNVDLQSGKIGLGVPQNVQPLPAFSRKSEIPVHYSQPGFPAINSGPVNYSSPPQAMLSSYPPVAAYPPSNNTRQNEHIYTSSHSGYPA